MQVVAKKSTLREVAKSVMVHHLVLEAFVGLRHRYRMCPLGDDVKTNNCLSNLSWGTKGQNNTDAKASAD